MFTIILHQCSVYPCFIECVVAELDIVTTACHLVAGQGNNVHWHMHAFKVTKQLTQSVTRISDYVVFASVVCHVK